MPAVMPFEVEHQDSATAARACHLETPHGVVETPAFMPVGTAGAVKGVVSWELERLAPQMVLANTYHLLLRPGVDRIEALGGLHRVMAWPGPILTDSGGFQVFSLAHRRKLDADGVTFNSHIDGSRRRLTPEGVVEAQARFGVDVAMVLDECPPSGAPRQQAEIAVKRSLDWARRCFVEAKNQRQQKDWHGGLFAIQQGALDRELRQRSIDGLAAQDFDGFAIGGLAVGEARPALYEAIDMAAPMLPSDRPRYLMGVGYPEDLLHAVAAGVDLFDCVLPTRSARNGKVFTYQGDLNLKNARHADDSRPLDEACECPTCRFYSRAVLRHLFISNEVTSSVLLTIHNLFFFLGLMRQAREAIIAGRYRDFRSQIEEKRQAATA